MTLSSTMNDIYYNLVGKSRVGTQSDQHITAIGRNFNPSLKIIRGISRPFNTKNKQTDR